MRRKHHLMPRWHTKVGLCLLFLICLVQTFLVPCFLRPSAKTFVAEEIPEKDAASSSTHKNRRGEESGFSFGSQYDAGITYKNKHDEMAQEKENESNALIQRIDRIYYINQARYTKRRSFMEGWLNDSTSKIPFVRVEAVVGDKDTCNPTKLGIFGRRCKSISGLIKSYFKIMDSFTTSGLTLVLQDDFVVKNLSIVEDSLKWVPPDWDVIRFDCLGDKPSSFVEPVNEHVFRTAHDLNKEETGWFCGGNHAVLWRNTSMYKLRDVWSRKPYDDIDCRLTTSEIKSYCVNLPGGIGHFHLPEGEESDYQFLLHSHKRDNKSISSIQRIYYINLAKNTKRRSFMEGWLGNLAQTIPYQRVDAVVGDKNTCVLNGKDGRRCQGHSGVIKTNLKIMDTLNTSGLTLVLEDDFSVRDLSMLEDSLALVPPDWDVIRFDCWGWHMIPSSFFAPVNDYVFRTAHDPQKKRIIEKEGERFCGGNHATLWRNTSLHKLRAVWSRKPYDDIDCRLATLEIKSYCVNLPDGLGGELYHPEGEETDIPLN